MMLKWFNNYRTLSFEDKTILLVDDVMTVGATLNECAKVLLKAGAKSVYTVTFAITCKK